MKFWLLDIQNHGISGKALMYGTEEKLIDYVQFLTGGFLWEYHEISESNANMLTRFLPMQIVPDVSSLR